MSTLRCWVKEEEGAGGETMGARRRGSYLEEEVLDINLGLLDDFFRASENGKGDEYCNMSHGGGGGRGLADNRRRLAQR